jgi:hypothetical protein
MKVPNSTASPAESSFRRHGRRDAIKSVANPPIGTVIP